MTVPDRLTLDDIRVYLPKKSDRELLGNAVQPGDDFVDKTNTYGWYAAVGNLHEPDSVLELGVRYGYAGIALSVGARFCSVSNCYAYVGVDSEYDGIESNIIADLNLRQHYSKVSIIKATTSNAQDTLGRIQQDWFDVVHVDGDHSLTGILNELHIAARCVAENGLILVDDCDTPHIKQAVEQFCKGRKTQPVYMPTVHITAVLGLEGGLRS